MGIKRIPLALRTVVLFTTAIGVWAQPPALKPGLYAIFDTSEGVITAVLYEKYTPIAVKNFVGLAQGTKPWLDPKARAWVKRPMYNGITFHRVVREQMIQSGDPTGIGNHNCGFKIRDEFLPGLKFDGPGKLGVANTGQPDTGGCQFFITEEAVPSWSNHYTIFGQVVAGQDVVNRIDKVPVREERPVEPVILKSVTIERVGKGKP
ncbi:MAG: peptidylprolyl isomerase [Bryobacteraceae bacterium]|jgi:cyclophilin family peptidyl-prolyl cis-trans isomerase